MLQVANQPAMEAVPLILEPESRFYTDPVLVLDFQSLYPSIIIAYNLCYSTVVGRPAHAAAAGQEVKLGAANYAVPPGTLTGPNAPHKSAAHTTPLSWPCAVLLAVCADIPA